MSDVPLLDSLEEARPPDVADAQWNAAMSGLRAFLVSGHADEALRLGWPPDELYRVPELWSQIHLTGCALLIGDRLVYETRRKALAGLGGDEPHLRARDYTINFCRQHSGRDLETAKAMVRDALAAKGTQP
jgi:hypothetical protein